MIVVLGDAVLTPDHFDEALALGIEHSFRSRSEPGCISHNVHIDAENPARIVFVERWTDMAALKTHFGVPASGEFVGKLRGWTMQPPSMTLYEANEARP